MTVNFLSETNDGRLAHSALSTVFVEDADMATWLSYLLNRSVPCMRAFTQATERWPDPVKGNETAYNLAMNTDLSFFDHLRVNPDLSAEFGKYMKSQSTVHAGAGVDHLLQGLDWAALGEAKVVDVRDVFLDLLESQLVLIQHRLAAIQGAPQLHWQRDSQISDLSSKIFQNPFTTPELKPSHFLQMFREELNSSNMTFSLHSQ